MLRTVPRMRADADEHPDPDRPYEPLDRFERDPAPVIAAAFGLALLGLLVPLAIVGALFAGVVLVRRGRPGLGAAVVAVGIASVVVGLLLR